jgi:hypothetical protein
MKSILTGSFTKRNLILLILLTAGTGLNVQGQVGGWQHLGNAHVDGRADHDRIDVGGGTFTALSMGVTNGAVEFERVVVHFRNGGDEVLPVATLVRSGGRTPPIPLRGGAREVKSVEIWYAKGQYAQGKPRVDLFGRR